MAEPRVGCVTDPETSVFKNWSQAQKGWKMLCKAKSSKGSFGYVPYIVQDEAFSRVEAGSDVPLLPYNRVALNLHTRTIMFEVA